MTLRELHATLEAAQTALLETRGNLPDGASKGACFAVGEALGTISKAKAMVGRDIDNAEAAPPDQRVIDAAPDLLAACKAQHHAIDLLFAMLIIATKNDAPHPFYPSQSGAPWKAAEAGFAAIAKAEGR